MNYQVIALDADDTLWHNERLFAETQSQFRALLSSYHDADWIQQRLNETELRNLQHFGYGIKGFVLSMIETAIQLSDGNIGGAEIQGIIDMGREMVHAPIELLDGVRETVVQLAAQHRLMLLTKGDLFDQEGKLARSGLGEYFHAIEIVSEKDVRTYAGVMRRHSVHPPEFLMVGNSLKSDILPVLEAGGAAVYIPYHIEWVLDQAPEGSVHGKEFVQLESIRDLPKWLQGR